MLIMKIAELPAIQMRKGISKSAGDIICSTEKNKSLKFSFFSLKCLYNF